MIRKRIQVAMIRKRIEIPVIRKRVIGFIHKQILCRLGKHREVWLIDDLKLARPISLVNPRFAILKGKKVCYWCDAFLGDISISE